MKNKLLIEGKLFKQNEIFGLIDKFELSVPKNYNPKTQLRSFAEKYKGKIKEDGSLYFHLLNDDISDEHFSKVTHPLEPGKTYVAYLFKNLIKKTIPFDRYLEFVKSQKCFNGGAQALSLVWEQHAQRLPIAKIIVTSFDERDALWIDGDGDMVAPYMRENAPKQWREYLDEDLEVPAHLAHLHGENFFHLRSFKAYGHRMGEAILCFSEK